VDILLAAVTVTPGRNVRLKFSFSPIYLYDGLVLSTGQHGDEPVRDPNDNPFGPDGFQRVCVWGGSTNLLYAKTVLPDDRIVETAGTDLMFEMLYNRTCDAVLIDRMISTSYAPIYTSDDYKLDLSGKALSAEPLAIATRQADAELTLVVRWTMHALLLGELYEAPLARVLAAESDPTSGELALSDFGGPEVQALAATRSATDGGAEAHLGVADDIVVRILSAAGHYGDIYQRSLSVLPRKGTENALWADGGLFSPAVWALAPPGGAGDAVRRCAPCPPGADCSGQGTTRDSMFAKPGFFLYKGDFVPCLNPGVCVGGEDGCAVGHTGGLCGGCKPGYEGATAEQGRCSACPDLWVSWGLWSGVVCFGMLVLLGLAFKTYTAASNKSGSAEDTAFGQLFKIVIAQVQISGHILMVQLDWPGPVRTMFKAMRATGGVGLGISSTFPSLGARCLFPDSTYPAFGLNLLALYCGAFALLGIPMLCMVVSYGVYSHAKKRRKRSHPFSLAYLSFALYMLQPAISVASLSLLSCASMGDDSYALPDLTATCWGNDHIFWLLSLALPGFLLFVVGVPSVTLCFLASGRRHELVAGKHKTLTRKFGFWVQGYNHEVWWWDWIMMWRKIVILGIFAALRQAPNFQVCAGALSFSRSVVVCLFLLLSLTLYFHRFFSPHSCCWRACGSTSNIPPSLTTGPTVWNKPHCASACLTWWLAA
jgi:hypothetical protein